MGPLMTQIPLRLLSKKVDFSFRLLRCRHCSNIRSRREETREWLKQYSGGSVDLHRENDTGIAVITVNNQEKKNALTGQMLLDFDDAITTLGSWSEGRFLILRGAGKFFCSGAELSFVQRILDKESGYKMSWFVQGFLSRMFALHLLSVAAMQGPAVGGGAELAGACDFRIMSDNAKIGFIQSKLGLTPGLGGGTRLVRIVGRTKALDLLASGRLLTAQQACDMGLVDKVLPEDCDIEEEARKWLAESFVPNTGVIRGVKSIVSAACEKEMLISLEYEREIFCKAWGSQEQRDALAQNLKHN